MSKFEEWEEPRKKQPESDTDFAEAVRVMNGKDLPHLAWSNADPRLVEAAWHELHLRAEILDESPTMAEFVANREREKRKREVDLLEGTL